MNLESLKATISKGQQAEQLLNTLLAQWIDKMKEELDYIARRESKIFINPFNNHEFAVKGVEEYFEEDGVAADLRYYHSTKRVVFYVEKKQREITITDDFDESVELLEAFIASYGKKYKRVLSVLCTEYIYRIFYAEKRWNEVLAKYQDDEEFNKYIEQETGGQDDINR